jgi:hypothetical protein
MLYSAVSFTSIEQRECREGSSENVMWDATIAGTTAKGPCPGKLKGTYEICNV